MSSVSEICFLGYCVGGNKIRPDPERLRPLLKFPAPTDSKSLKRALGRFAYYAKWITYYSDKIVHLKNSKTFPLTTEALKEYETLEKDIVKASLQAIDENCPFIVECNALEMAISATSNQAAQPVAFMSRTFRSSERHYPAMEKEATAIIESARKWLQLLARRHLQH